jgi:Glycosyltransferase family 87
LSASETPIPVRSYKTVALFFVLSIVASHLLFLWNVHGQIFRGDPDFTVFYTAGRILREGHSAQLYDPGTQSAVQREFTANSDRRAGPLPFIHPPFEAVIFVPFTCLSYPAAFVSWSALNLLLLCAVVFLLKPSLLFLSPVSWWKVFLASLAFFPVFANFQQGQDAILLLFVLSLSYRALEKNAVFLAGCWLALGDFRYHLILPLFFILAIWKGRRFILGFLTVSTLLAGLSLGIVGWRGALEYPAFAWNIISHPEWGGVSPRLLPNLMGLLAGWPGLSPVQFHMLLVVVLCSTLLLLAVVFACNVARSRCRFDLCFSLAVIAALLVGFGTNTYDLSLLVLPVLLLANYVQNLEAKQSTVLHLLLPIVPLLISPIWFLLWLKWERLNVIAVFLIWWLFAIRHELRKHTAAHDVAIPMRA